MIKSEEWKVVPFATSYEISSYGRIRRIGKARAAVRGKILKWTADKDGYLQIGGSMNNKRVMIKAHRAVLFAFKGLPPTKKHFASHEDGINSNNHVDNLEWRTQKENLKLKIKHGTHGISLTLEKVRRIRKLREEGYTYQNISTECSTSISAVAHIVKRRCWANDNP